jgi:hypothetical protein
MRIEKMYQEVFRMLTKALGENNDTKMRPPLSSGLTCITTNEIRLLSHVFSNGIGDTDMRYGTIISQGNLYQQISITIPLYMLKKIDEERKDVARSKYMFRMMEKCLDNNRK